LLRPPAAGYRANSTGALGYVGERGHVWSSSSNYAGNRNAGLMWFHSGLVNPLDNSYLAHAFSVRCVQN